MSITEVRDDVRLSLPMPSRSEPGDGKGAWPFMLDHVSNFAVVQDVLSKGELDAIVRIGEAINLERGVTGGGDRTEVRDSFVSWLYPNEVTSWLFGRMTDVALQANDAWFRFDLYGFTQGFQFTNYRYPKGHYDWHIDRGGATGTRKLSFSVQLSDPDDYDGGDVQLWFGGREDEIVTAPRERGTIVFFPSYAMHRVTPVTRGLRQSLVAWIEGPAFR